MSEGDYMNMDDKITLTEYSMEPFYGQQIEDNRNTFNYILRIPGPLDSEQIKAILMVIKEMRGPRDYTTKKITIADWKEYSP